MEKLLSSLGQVSAIIGAQWGDEGKGKVTDILSEHFQVIARASGGANAGHTIVVNGKKHVFHLLPSGCLHEGKKIFLGGGMVIHLPTLLGEIELLRQSGVDIVPRLRIASHAHLVMDFHKDIDAALEEMRSQGTGSKLGTTKRGIGPAYMDKAGRTGLRVEHLEMDEKVLREIIEGKAGFIESTYGVSVNVKQEVKNILDAKETLWQSIAYEAVSELYDNYANGQTILIEGAQATLLDIDHGTYPYVTSSTTTATGALHALGLPPQSLSSCIGVVKAYCTRVGSGPFFTEAPEEDANRLRERGGEYGATTGRPRRCGWLNLPDVQYATMINGYTHWNLTKLDVLDEEENIPIGVGYGQDGQVVYENLPGWKVSTAGIKEFEELPSQAQQYIHFIEEHTGLPVSFIGTGQGRKEMIIR